MDLARLTDVPYPQSEYRFPVINRKDDFSYTLAGKEGTVDEDRIEVVRNDVPTEEAFMRYQKRDKVEQRAEVLATLLNEGVLGECDALILHNMFSDEVIARTEQLL